MIDGRKCQDFVSTQKNMFVADVVVGVLCAGTMCLRITLTCSGI